MIMTMQIYDLWECKLARKEDMDFGSREWDKDISQTEEMEGKTSEGIMLRYRSVSYL